MIKILDVLDNEIKITNFSGKQLVIEKEKKWKFILCNQEIIIII